MAGRIETAARIIRKNSYKDLPHIDRTDLCEACSKCPFAKQHKEKTNG